MNTRRNVILSEAKDLDSNLEAIRAGRRRAFTLTELLIVIGIIVVMIAMAIPLFNVMTGDRGVEGGENVLSAMLQRARARAIAVQEPRGVFFFEDPATGQYMTCVVKVTPTLVGSVTWPVIDLDPQDDEAVPLTRGVGIVASFGYPSGHARYDRRHYPYGLVMFDGLGRIQPTEYYILEDNTDHTQSKLNLLRRFAINDLDTATENPPEIELSTAAVMLYSKATFQKDPNDSARRFKTPSLDWMDQNAFALVVNRYNGTLIRGE